MSGYSVEVVARRVFYVISFMLAGCAYQWGSSERSLPGGYRQISIPVFANATQEVGIEVDFTNALIREFERSKVARVVNDQTAAVRLEGNVESLNLVADAPAKEEEITALPKDTAYFTQYRIFARTRLRLRRLSDQAVVWEGTFSNEKVYPTPRIGSAVVNSANALYNQSVRRDTVGSLAREMMEEAHDRMTENF